ncbi:zinc-dependent metalloprotease family protein [Alishewanella sp. HL-SH06]|uniref:zinc-dependent metalloprotease family protein n=1 Tax=Alishewanella sp. HL-SH06 TaxID=3461144 RepID=UPI0040418475
MLKKVSFLALFLFAITSYSANALLIKVDFTSTSTDMWGNTTSAFDVTQAGFAASAFNSLTDAIMTAVRNDFYNSSLYGFISNDKQLNIDFIKAAVTDDVSAIDPNHYTIQVGSRLSSSPFNGLGVACYTCVSSSTIAPNTIFGSIFSNNIFSALTINAGFSWDTNEAVNAIAGTLSHEIGHGLGLAHPTLAQPNPGESAWGLMATGAAPSNMPNSERLKDRAFSYDNMGILVNNLGERSAAVSEPPAIILFLSACLMLFFQLRKKNNQASLMG